jgi:hypothetical protein
MGSYTGILRSCRPIETGETLNRIALLQWRIVAFRARVPAMLVLPSCTNLCDP